MKFFSAKNKRRSSDSNRKVARQLIQPLESRRLLSIAPAIDLFPDASASTVSGYTPAQIQTAYGFSQLSFASGKTAANGAGQTIAIVDAYNDPDIASDLKTFDTKFGLATADLKVVNQTGGSTLPASNGGWAEEISLDVEWAHAVAPGANILLVETNSDSTSDLLAGVNYARTVSGVSVVSMSWGGSEFNGETSYDSDFTTPSGHTGITFVAASGDDGGVDWPASSPDVLSVGGTELVTSSSSGTYSSESGWVDSGGGVSRFEGEPEYQNSVQSEYARTVPDVSADADPNTGVAVYDSDSYDGYSGWIEFGGTSAAAPQWAGLIAIADQGRVLNKLSTLNGATNTLPTLYDLEKSSSTYSADFHNITGSGYNLLTGIGSPKANNLVPALVSSTVNTPLTVTTRTVYMPPPWWWFGQFFVETSQGAFPGELLTSGSPSFETSATNSPLSIEGYSTSAQINLAATNVSALNPVIAEPSITVPHNASAIDSDITSDKALAKAMSVFITPLSDSPSNRVAPPTWASLQKIEDDLSAVKTFANQVISDLARDSAIALAHLESIMEFDSSGTLGGASFNSWQSAMIAGSSVAAAIYIGCETQREKQNQVSPFSQQLIEVA